MMDEDELASNPFAALFPTISVAQCYVKSHDSIKAPAVQNSMVESMEMEVGPTLLQKILDRNHLDQGCPGTTGLTRFASSLERNRQDLDLKPAIGFSTRP